MYKKHYQYDNKKSQDKLWGYLSKRGVTRKMLVSEAYADQKTFMPEVPLSEYDRQFDQVLNKRNILNNCLIGFYLDDMATQKKLPEPLQGIMEADPGVFEVDELLALDNARDYGMVGVTNFGKLDCNKTGASRRLDRNINKVNVFGDDLINSLVSALEAKVMNWYYEVYVYQNYDQAGSIV